MSRVQAAPMLIPPGADGLDFCLTHGLARPGRRLRLHLGCGEKRLPGYLNLDFPPSEHTVQAGRGAADVFADIVTLRFPAGSVDEIRLHHVFEHFDRPTALALLCNWHTWLKPGGKLTLETPDFDTAARRALAAETSYAEQQIILRHIFGSHEAAWAVHFDGWSEAKFRRTLEALGYERLSFQHTQYGPLNNILAQAHKATRFDRRSLALNAQRLLRQSLVDRSLTEEQMGQVWLRRFEALFETGENTPAPRLSILLPVQDDAAGLAHSLDSLLGQDFPDFEIIVAERGSNDASLETAYRYAGCERRIRVLPLWRAGVALACNQAATQAHPAAAYLLRQPAGDVALPGKLRRLVETLEAEPGIAMLGCQAAPAGAQPLESGGQGPYAVYAPLDEMPPGATLMRREAFAQLGGYAEEYDPLDEYDLFVRALQAGLELACLPETLHQPAPPRPPAGRLGQVEKLRRVYLERQVQYRAQDQLAARRTGAAAPWPRLWAGLRLAVARLAYRGPRWAAQAWRRGRGLWRGAARRARAGLERD